MLKAREIEGSEQETKRRHRRPAAAFARARGEPQGSEVKDAPLWVQMGDWAMNELQSSNLYDFHSSVEYFCLFWSFSTTFLQKKKSHTGLKADEWTWMIHFKPNWCTNACAYNFSTIFIRCLQSGNELICSRLTVAFFLEEDTSVLNRMQEKIWTERPRKKQKKAKRTRMFSGVK